MLDALKILLENIFLLFTSHELFYNHEIMAALTFCTVKTFIFHQNFNARCLFYLKNFFSNSKAAFLSTYFITELFASREACFYLDFMLKTILLILFHLVNGVLIFFMCWHSLLLVAMKFNISILKVIKENMQNWELFFHTMHILMRLIFHV